MIRKKILFATSFSARDEKAFRVACQFASAWDATLLVVHVDDASEETPAISPRLDPRQDLYRIVPENLEVDVEHILRYGDPADEILEIEGHRNVVLIVLGTHGRKGLDRLFSGSIAEKVMRDADCPVMTIRDSEPEKPIDHDGLTRVLVPVDFSVYSYAALDFACVLAKTLEAEVTILHVDESVDESDRRLAEGSSQWNQHESEIWNQLTRFTPRDRSIQFHHKLIIGPADKRIPKYANSKHYDLVVLGTHGRNGIGRVLMGSVAERVVRESNVPVVTVKPSNKRTTVLHG